MVDYKKWAAIGQLVLAMALGGSSVPVGKTLAVTLPLFPTIFATLLAAWMIMLPLVWGRRDEIRALTRREWGYLFLQGLCGIVLFRIFLFLGLQHMGASQAGIITGATPAVLTILSLCMLKERPTPGAVAGVACAVAGGVCLAAAGDLSLKDGSLLGGLLVFSAVVSEALFTIWRKRVATTVSATVNTAMLISCALVTVLPFALWDCRKVTTAPTAMELAAILYYGAVATVFAYLLWARAVGRVDGAPRPAPPARPCPPPRCCWRPCCWANLCGRGSSSGASP
ncbi:MAG: DMT family transporter [Salinivirgaceae bacterium]|nr:DMT family transporter [Salinivirgaceae bacterium]